MNYTDEISDIIEDANKNDTPTSSELGEEIKEISKTIQIVIDPQTSEPTINYTEDLNYLEIIGALDIAKETLIKINVEDRLTKRRMLRAYSDV